MSYKPITRIAMPENYRTIFTLEECDQCKLVQAALKDISDSGRLNLSGAVCLAAVAGSDNHVSGENVLAASAEFCKNSRVFDAHCEGSGNIDVWIRVYAFDSYYGFYEICACLTDIWYYDSNDPDATKRHMYICHYTNRK